MSSEEIDLEDIEARLYSQVYHASAENEGVSLTPSNTGLIAYPNFQSNPYSINHGPKQYNRYFQSEKSATPTYISFGNENKASPQENTISPRENPYSVTNNISFSPNSTGISTEGTFPNQFQNNITVNQYTLPPEYMINSDLDEVLHPPFGSKLFTKWSTKYDTLLNKKRKKQRKLEKRRARNQEQLAKVSNHIVTRSATNKAVKNSVNNFLVQINLGNNHGKKKETDIISVSDDSDDEVILVKETHVEPRKIYTGFPKKYDETAGGKKPESDNDDIIYIPPPPIEVINVDVEDIAAAQHEIRKDIETVTTAGRDSLVGTTTNNSNSVNSPPAIPAYRTQYNPKEIRELLETPESTASNDFLEGSSLENCTNKFNFGLHGSDFRNAQVDFLRPANPVDFAETESSCSTNEANRDFNNSVKTIVFNEVEFPREDIFSENNLESFGSFITPKRKLSKSSKITAEDYEKGSYKDILNNNTSSDSSSESEPTVNQNIKMSGPLAHAKLPNLSPMLSQLEPVTHKRHTPKKKTSTEFIKDHSTLRVPLRNKKEPKRKYSSSEETDSGSEIDVETVKPVKNKPKKSKKKAKDHLSTISTVGNVEDICFGKDKSTKKKKNSMSSEAGQVITEDVPIEIQKKKKRNSQKIIEQNSNNSLEKVKKKNKKSIESKTAENEGILETPLKKQKKRRGSKNAIVEESIETDNEESIIEVDSPIKSKKKKKKGACLEIDDVSVNVEKQRKKKKKTSISLEQDPEDDLEISQNKDNGFIDVEKQSKKKKKSSISLYQNTDGKKNCSLDHENISVDVERKKKKKESISLDQQALENVEENKILENIEIPIDVKQLRKKKKSCVSLDHLTNNNMEENATNLQQTEQPTSITINSEIREANSLNQLIESESKTMKVIEKDYSPDKGNENGGQQREPQIKTQTIEKLVYQTSENSINTEHNLNHVSATIIEEEKVNSDEEIIVVDIQDNLDMSNLLVVDETFSDAEIEVVDSSDSDDFRDLGEVGTDLKLANCSVNLSTDAANELIVVDDSSGSNYSNRFAVNMDYMNFDVNCIQRTQTDDPESWKISYEDRMYHLNIDRQRGLRCNKCRHFGHKAIRCPEKPHTPGCSLCGHPGHQEPRCPNKMCTQCGTQGDYSTTYCWNCIKFRHTICRICNMKGHIAKYCPDLWRRYHLTTEEGPIVIPQEPILKPRDQQWCSGCAHRGHLEHECDYYHRAYPPTNPSIASYEDVLYRSSTNRLCQENVNSPVPPVQTPVVPPLSNTIFYPQSMPVCAQDMPIYAQNMTNATVSNSTQVIPPPLMSLEVPEPLAPIQSENIVIPSLSSPPTQVFPPPLMSLEVPEPLAPIQSERIVIPSLSSPNLLVKIPNSYEKPKPVLNPFSLFGKSCSANTPLSNHALSQMELNYIKEDGNDLKHLLEPDKIKQIIMSMPSSNIKEFLSNEMAELEKVSNANPKFLKKQLFRVDRISQSKKPTKSKITRAKYFWYRTLNMFVFGVHKFRDGNMHLQYLRKFLSESKQNKFDEHKRRSVFSAYNYIFGIHKHVNVNYYKIIQMLVQRYDDGKVNKNIF